jgi:hypothetical protein
MVQNTNPPFNVISAQELHTTRALSNVYTNNTGRTIFLNVTVYHIVTVAGGWGQVIGKLNGTPVTKVSTNTGASALNDDGAISLTMFIPPGKTYEIAASSSNMTWTLTYWQEAL